MPTTPKTVQYAGREYAIEDLRERPEGTLEGKIKVTVDTRAEARVEERWVRVARRGDRQRLRLHDLRKLRAAHIARQHREAGETSATTEIDEEIAKLEAELLSEKQTGGPEA